MKLQKTIIPLLCIFASMTCTYAQFSVRAGVNLANEDKVFNGNNDMFTGYQADMLNAFNIGVMYQLLSSKGIGGETGIIFSQKGSNFSYTDAADASIRGYNETGYIEIPLNAKYIFRIGVFGIFASAGVYGGCAFYGKTTLEAETDIETPIQYATFANRLDAGYNAGGGIELFKKLQIGVNWSQSFISQDITENIVRDTPVPHKNRNRILAINLAYFFK